jgi:Phospholipase_D-nuclease N-terminal
MTFGPELLIIPFGLLFVGSFIVWIWALVDAIQVQDDSMYRSGTKLLWVLVILLTHLLSPDTLLRLSRLRERKAGGEALH